jgi:hypothetical protein
MAVQQLIRLSNLSYRWLLLLSVAAAASHSAYCVDARTFTSDMFGYRLTVPLGWHLAVPPSGVPVIFNYDESHALPQGLIPSGGADIYLIPYEAVSQVTRARDLQEWIRANSEEWHTNVRTARIAAGSKDARAPQEIVRVEADYERSPDDETLQTEINYYFVLHGSDFRLRMLFGKGDPRSSYFRTVIDTLLRSIQSTAPLTRQ